MTPLLINLMRTKWGCHTGPFHQVSGSWGGTATCQEGNAGKGAPAAACVGQLLQGHGCSHSPATVPPSIAFPLAAEPPVPSQVWQGHPSASGRIGWDAGRAEAMPKWEPSPPFFPFCS